MLKVMISSTVGDLEADRDAAHSAVTANPLFEAVGVGLGQQSSSSSPLVTTRKMADECDLYLLILGGRYGYEVFENKSATEVEFDAAYKNDPTKVILFRKELKNIESKQRAFIEKVSDYYSGYWYNIYEHTHTLKEMLEIALMDWIVGRCRNKGASARDESFLRLAADMRPRPEFPMLYSVSEADIKLQFPAPKRNLYSHFGRESIARDFWGCLKDLQAQVYRWEKDA